MTIAPPNPRLRMLPQSEYVAGDDDDPLRFYDWPLIGRLYRRRVELCLAECRGGERVLEVGFGAGVTFTRLVAQLVAVEAHQRRFRS